MTTTRKRVILSEAKDLLIDLYYDACMILHSISSVM